MTGADWLARCEEGRVGREGDVGGLGGAATRERVEETHQEAGRQAG